MVAYKEKKADKREKEDRAEAGAGMDHVRLNAMGSSGQSGGGKHGQYEGGIRIPFLLRWPGHVPAGRVDDTSVLSGADWLPTLCRLTAVKLSLAWSTNTFSAASATRSSMPEPGPMPSRRHATDWSSRKVSIV